MTTTQSFKIYEVLQRHFKNNDDAKVVVQEIEQIIETKVENKITILTTKEDLLKFQVDVEKRFNSMILWVVGTGIGVVGLILSIIKLFIIN
jgi:hypothetical protein